MNDDRKIANKKIKNLLELIIGLVVVGGFFWFEFYDRRFIDSVGEKLAQTPIITISILAAFSLFLIVIGVKNLKEKSYLEGQWKVLAGLVFLVGILVYVAW